MGDSTREERVYEFRELSTKHLPRVKELCRQLYPAMSAAGIEGLMQENLLGALKLDPGVVLEGAFVRGGSDDPVAYITAGTHPASDMVEDGQQGMGCATLSPVVTELFHAAARDVLRRSGAKPDDSVFLISQFIVDPHHRHRRVGGTLLQRVRDRGAKCGAKFARLVCDTRYTAACTLYESAGFLRAPVTTHEYLFMAPIARGSGGSGSSGSSSSGGSSSSSRAGLEGRSVEQGTQTPPAVKAPPSAAQPVERPAAPRARVWGQSLQRPRSSPPSGGGGSTAGMGEHTGTAPHSKGSSRGGAGPPRAAACLPSPRLQPLPHRVPLRAALGGWGTMSRLA